ncbi:MAPEG family protein [Rhizobium sp. SSA_523]|uniref:MAPEG family protein n=1 Tax=Rhizobium sp. SSA_523 TaxID=2952477 RepID=UPI00209054AB|nr:MAPEG family protein [Rhizobium sp. SSA_523]MCO5733150.1 MAPEG family protein [Rhizobium sp. SSA_523]WKC24023.1 MAPEG family protein [Rhizobium sp. SSA_523]
MTTNEAMIWPMIAHVALVFLLYFILSGRRVAAVRAGRATVAQFRENLKEPDDSLFVHNNLKNQFELPILFHVVCITLYVVQGDNIGTVLLAWAFVLSRYVHAYIHVTSNRIRYRRPAFIAGFACLALLWAWLAVWLAMT